MQNNYETYSAGEFLEDAFFIEWIRNPTPAAEQFWADWVRNAPPNIYAMREAEVELRSILSVKRINPANGDAVQVWDQIRHSLQQEPAKEYRMQLQWRPLYKWAAAAVILFLVFGIRFMVGRDRTEKPSVAVAPKVEDIAPGGDKAILTLADGSRVVLDSADNGAISRQGNITVIKLNGQLAYNKEGAASPEVLYNTISTPRGGQYQLVLADGSRVWLNAASSLRFPTAFTGKERRVELTGEGYFEVAHEAEKPFIVQRGETEVKVLGTHFNINAYSNEPSLKVTLLEGRVMVKKADKLVYLNPGQQAVVQPEQNNIKVNDNVNTEEVVAWKNGYFLFNSADIETVMRQIARWYDVEVVYQEKTSETISGGLPRSQALSQLTKILEATGKLDLEIKGKQIIVKPK